MKRIPMLFLVVLLCAAAVPVVLAAESAKSPSVQTKIKRVALFKNGLGFFVREGALTGDESNALLGLVSAPAHGTFWVMCPGTSGLKNVISREVTGTEASPARNTYELLQANIGKVVSLGMPWESNALVGTIVSFGPPAQRPFRPSPYGMQEYYLGPDDGGRAQYMIFKTVTGQTLILSPNDYSRISFLDREPVTTIERETRKTEIAASFASAKKGDWLSVSYLAKGITWAPSYLLDISDPKKAQLSASALIINEAEDLEGVDVDLVTGFPNIILADVFSPMARRENLAGFLNALSQGRSSGGRDQYGFLAQAAEGMANVAGAYARSRDEAGEVPSYGAAAAGQTAEDLFLYPVENVKLSRNETGQYPLFTETVPYVEVYEWKIPDYITREERYQAGDDTPTEIVWHNLRLTNTMKLPWTTAPVQLMKDGQLLGQSKLDYTAVGAQGTVTITRALSVKAEQTELEIEREQEAIKMRSGYYYDRVTLQGTLVITNFQEKAIPLEITKTLSGDVKSTSLAAKDITLARGIQRVNPVHQLTWKLDLKPGESKEITYTYQALIRR